MEYRFNADELIRTLSAWDDVLPGRGRIHLIACGGTALTLLGYKESTKDVDFLVPVEREYKRLREFLVQAGYKPVTGYGWKRPNEAILFDLYLGKAVYQTELLTSPLIRGGNRKIREWNKIYLGVLNPLDLIISKMFRGDEADIQDSLSLFKNEKVPLSKLEKRYRETAKYYFGEDKALRNLEVLLARLKKAAL